MTGVPKVSSGSRWLYESGCCRARSPPHPGMTVPAYRPPDRLPRRHDVIGLAMGMVGAGPSPPPGRATRFPRHAPTVSAVAKPMVGTLLASLVLPRREQAARTRQALQRPGKIRPRWRRYEHHLAAHGSPDVQPTQIHLQFRRAASTADRRAARALAAYALHVVSNRVTHSVVVGATSHFVQTVTRAQ